MAGIVLQQPPTPIYSETAEIQASWQFSGATMSVLEQSWEECRVVRQAFISPLAILRALLRGENSANYLIQSLGVDFDALQVAVQNALVPARAPAGMDPYLSPRSKQVLLTSWRETCRWDADEIEPEHLLIALLLIEGAASRILVEHGLGVDAVKSAFAKALAKGDN